MALIFNIRLEARPHGGKWETTFAETSHWPSGEQLLASYVKANPAHETRLVAELIPASVDIMEASPRNGESL